MLGFFQTEIQPNLLENCVISFLFRTPISPKISSPFPFKQILIDFTDKYYFPKLTVIVTSTNEYLMYNQKNPYNLNAKFSSTEVMIAEIS